MQLVSLAFLQRTPTCMVFGDYIGGVAFNGCLIETMNYTSYYTKVLTEGHAVFVEYKV